MLKQLALRYPEHTLNYGVVLRDHTLHPRDRIRVNGEPVDSSVFELCSSECKKRLEAEGSRICQPGCSFAEKLDTMVVSIALHVFNRLNVTAIAISMPHTPTLPTQAPNAAAAAAASESSSDAATLCLEQLVMEIFCPKIVICGFEPLPSYADSLPEEWRKSLIYLMRRSVHVISTSQPKPVRVQLLSLTKIFGLTIELAQALTAFPACKDIRLGIFGPDQHQYAKLALAISQTWAFRHGLLRSRSQNQAGGEYTAAMALSPIRDAAAKPVPPSPYQMQIQSMLRDTSSWMVRGLTSACHPGFFHSVSGEPKNRPSWHYSWADTPSDFARTGAWFNGVCQSAPKRHRMLLIHLPESFLSAVRYQHESDGTWLKCDYRELLKALYIPLRSVAWSSCVFAADTLNESNVIDSCVPPTLAQYALRDYWAQLTGLCTDQIHIAPSLACAVKLITAKCAVVPQVDPSDRQTYANGARSDLPSSILPSFFSPRNGMLLESASPTLPPSQLVQPSPSGGASMLLSRSRPSLALNRSAIIKPATSADNLRDIRRKLSFGIGSSNAGGYGTDLTASLPFRSPRQQVPLPTISDLPVTPPFDILVTGSKSFVLKRAKAVSAAVPLPHALPSNQQSYPLHRKLRLSGYMRRREADLQLVRTMSKKFGKDLVLVIGNWSAVNVKSHEPIRGKSWRDFLKRQGFKVYLIYEFRTSCICPVCDSRLENFLPVPNPRVCRRKRKPTVLCHGLLRCSTQYCL
ncbi:hypothetical protein GGI18_000289 [Coemansia linderi]|uniref:Uncharacterized protein n=1 Tax=Coemansia linderi TaxID=2663919 RepID=A0ACC1KNY0_9FUNG|nr:hypothetical protein GGI18_000289 [Coemansia linderi]